MVSVVVAYVCKDFTQIFILASQLGVVYSNGLSCDQSSLAAHRRKSRQAHSASVPTTGKKLAEADDLGNQVGVISQ
jgi:hypothetical protein